MRKLLPNVRLLQCYGLSETGFLTGLEDHEHVESKLLSCGRPCPGIDLRVEDETGREVEVGQHGELVARAPTSCGATGTIRKTRLSAWWCVKVRNWIREHRGIYRLFDFPTAERSRSDAKNPC